MIKEYFRQKQTRCYLLMDRQDNLTLIVAVAYLRHLSYKERFVCEPDNNITC